MGWLILRDAGQLVSSFSAIWSRKNSQNMVCQDPRAQVAVPDLVDCRRLHCSPNIQNPIMTVTLLAWLTSSLMKGFYSEKIYCTCEQYKSATLLFEGK